MCRHWWTYTHWIVWFDQCCEKLPQSCAASDQTCTLLGRINGMRCGLLWSMIPDVCQTVRHVGGLCQQRWIMEFLLAVETVVDPRNVWQWSRFSSCRPEGLEQFAGRHYIFCIPLSIFYRLLKTFCLVFCFLIWSWSSLVCNLRHSSGPRSSCSYLDRHKNCYCITLQCGLHQLTSSTC